MTTTHTIDLLLSNLPPKARLVHQLSGLFKNLLSVTVLLCNAGCKVLFPQNRLRSHPQWENHLARVA
jgi:hypothetical protein